MTRSELRLAALRILRAGLAAVEPGLLVKAQLRTGQKRIHIGGIGYKVPARLFVVSVGKAAVPMARAAHEILGARIFAAIVIAPRKAPRMARTLSLVSGHPIPDAAGVRASGRVIHLLESAQAGDLVLLLLSGGASALMPAPVSGVSLSDKQRLTRLLLKAGATIQEINAVRKQLSRLKGGGFARLAAPARVITLALSDVLGDDIRTIGSGPTVEDPKAAARARSAVTKFLKGYPIPKGVRLALRRRTAKGVMAKTVRTRVIGSGRTFAHAALRKAQNLGFRVQVLADALRGEARFCGPDLVLKFAARRGRRPLCLIATGETVVKVRGKGQGGRNQEVALSAVPALGQHDRATVMATFATDGQDGNSSSSGGLVDDRTELKALRRGVAVQKALEQNDSNQALRRLRGLIITGPTGTNVADIAVVLG